MRAQLLAALKVLLTITLLAGVAYPLVVTGIAQVAFNDQADGSLIDEDGTVVGSSLLGQQFEDEKWFQPRPSAAGAGYDGLASAGTNLGPTNPDLIKSVRQRVIEYRKVNGLAASERVPVDAVTSSGSGLDPHISKANAGYQAQRVARARGLPLKKVRELVVDNTDDPSLGYLGESGVNVLELNLALRQLAQT